MALGRQGGLVFDALYSDARTDTGYPPIRDSRLTMNCSSSGRSVTTTRNNALLRHLMPVRACSNEFSAANCYLSKHLREHMLSLSR